MRMDDATRSSFQEIWRYSNIKCCTYPLRGIDTITDGGEIGQFGSRARPSEVNSRVLFVQTGIRRCCPSSVAKAKNI